MAHRDSPQPSEASINQALRESEARYRELADAMPQLVWVSDGNGKVEYYNSRVSQYAGVQHNADGSWGWQPVIHHDDLEPTLAAWQAAQNGDFYQYEHRMRMYDGSYRWHLSRAHATRDANGQIVKWYGTATDIDDRKQVEEQAQRAADRTNRLQRVTAALSAALTPTEVAQTVVQQSVTALDAALGSLRVVSNDGRQLAEIYVTGADTSSHWSELPLDANWPLTDAVRNGQPIWLESLDAVGLRYPELVPLMQAYGYVSSASLPVAAEGRVIGAIALSFTEPHVFSPDDQAFLMTLAQQCAQALERARLYEAERGARAEAEAAVKLRDQFLSLAAHELKTPLTTLLGNAQLLQRRGEREALLAEREQRNVRLIVEQARRLNSMVLALLDVSRIENGQLTIERRPVDMAAFMLRIVEETRPSVEGRTISLLGTNQPCWINGDDVRLEQVFQNLISNALKYSPANTPIVMSLTRTANQVCIAVADQGIGIPADALPQLFQRFYRVNSAASRHINGLGLGLYVVREIVMLHDGRVDVASSEGQGSTFTVCLPLLQTPQKPATGGS